MQPVQATQIVINSVSDWLKEVLESPLRNEKNYHLRAWFRGQSNIAWNLEPGVYRADFTSNSGKENLTKECHLTQDFKALGAGVLSGRETDSELYFIQQHFGMPTRLLDWTTNPLAALWFAVSDSDKYNVDGVVAAMDVYQLFKDQGASDKNGKPYEGIVSSRGGLLKDAVSPIFSWGKISAFPNFIIPVRPNYSVERLGLQRSCFTFHVPNRKTLTINENRSLKTYIIPQQAKSVIKAELAALGMDSFSIYGDLEGLSRRLKYSYGIIK